MNGKIGVAISTTGDPHRLGFLETSIERWRQVLPLGSVLVVTVDGDEAACERVRSLGLFVAIRVGQPDASRLREGRSGVAVNKNTGIETLMASGVEHLYLSDDDTYPLGFNALHQHIRLNTEGIQHSMVCWGRSRFKGHHFDYDTWTWPRGVMLYTHRSVVERVGGMDERFGPGGHEHVEWSRRIHQAGFTPDEFCSPPQRADKFWRCEDMPRLNESLVDLGRRRKQITSVRRNADDWPAINAVMESMKGSTGFVPYRATENGRASATLCTTYPSGRGAGVDGGEK